MQQRGWREVAARRSGVSQRKLWREALRDDKLDGNNDADEEVTGMYNRIPNTG
jgi:hypothetical protein